MSCKSKIIYGKEVAEKIKTDIKNQIDEIKNQGKRIPCLAVILVGEDPASKVYVNNKHKTCLELGIESKMVVLDKETKEIELLNIIDELNNDKNIDGILVQMPLPKHISEDKVINKISEFKDVDCFHPANIGRMFSGNPRFLPCTPAGVMQMLKYENIEIAGKNAVVIGRSNIVGKPMAMLLLKENATVTIVHSKTKDIKSIVKNADIVISAVGIKYFVSADMIKDGAVVIDVGINRVDGKLYGDVDFDEVCKKTAYLTPVPGGVGLMTIAALMQNTLKAYFLMKN